MQVEYKLPDKETAVNNSGVDLYFKNLSYSVVVKDKIIDAKGKQSFFKQKQNRLILNDVSGIAKSGEVTAIMGSSGAGKTSLINVLACRVNKKSTSGQFLANGETYNSNKFAEFAAYVMQDDILLATLTPYECLLFAANLRMPGPQSERIKRVNKMLADFRIKKCAHTFVGDDLKKGISGGERKRTSIAVEMITNPQLIILDEPTSGLDSFTAYLIIKILKDFAQQGKTVIFTIHQPNQDIFQLFDQLILMVQGKFIYHGLAKDALNYFSNLGYECPRFTNVADYLMNLMHREYQPDTYQNRVTTYIEIYNKKVAPAIEDKIIFLAILDGLVFLRLSDNPKESTAFYNRFGSLFLVATDMYFSSQQPTVLTFPKERPLFLKEENSKLYSVLPYFLGRTVVELPVQILIPTVYSLILYWMIGFNDNTSEKFIIFWLTCICIGYVGSIFYQLTNNQKLSQTIFITLITASALGTLLGASISDQKAAMSASPLVFIPFILFSGFYKNRKDLPSWSGWFEFLSPFKYGLEALSVNEFSDSNFVNPKYLGQASSPLQFFGFELGIWKCIGILIGMSIGFRIIAFLALKLSVKKVE